MNAGEITFSLTAIVNALAGSLNDEELALLSTALTQLADTLATVSAHRAFFESGEKRRGNGNISEEDGKA